MMKKVENKIDFSKMTKEEAIIYCYNNEDTYIKGFFEVSEGKRQFDCLISCLDSESIKPSELPEYGME